MQVHEKVKCPCCGEYVLAPVDSELPMLKLGIMAALVVSAVVAVLVVKFCLVA